MKRLYPFALAACLLMPSCAYMQSNKSVAEMGAHYVGAELKTTSLELYSGAGGWYLAAPKVLLKRHYPLFYDTVYFDRNNDPTESVVRGSADGARLYLPISDGTAQVLQRCDGYAELPALLSESKSLSPRRQASETAPLSAKRYAINAKLEAKGSDASYYVLKRMPEHPSVALKCLSTVDKCTVDVIGTVVYNVALPVMAPFRFFAEFLTED